MQNFMNGRNGVDDLSAALGGIGVVLALLGTIFTWRIASYIALAILLVALFRAFSKNLAARERENDWFHSVMAKLPGGGSFARNRQTNAGARRSGTGSAAGTATADFKRQARTGPHGQEDVEGAQGEGVPQVPQLRHHALRPARQGQDHRHLPQMPRPHGDKVVTARQAAAQRHPLPARQSRDTVEIDAHPVWPLG